MRLGQEARKRRIVTLEVIPDRVNSAELTLLRGRVDAITIPALRNWSHDESYPKGFEVTPQQRSIGVALILKRTGIEAVPSLTCRDCLTEDVCRIPSLVQAGLESFLAVYGDPFGSDRDRYEFSKTHDLIRLAHAQGNGNSASIGAITNQYAADTEREVTRTLNRVDSGADFVLTNTSFDEEQVLEHRDRLRSAGLDVPLLIQVSIAQSLENLLFVGRKFGIAIPRRLANRLQNSPRAGVEAAAEAFDSLKDEAEGIHFSYLLRKRTPVPAYTRLLDEIASIRRQILPVQQAMPQLVQRN